MPMTKHQPQTKASHIAGVGEGERSEPEPGGSLHACVTKSHPANNSNTMGSLRAAHAHQRGLVPRPTQPPTAYRLTVHQEKTHTRVHAPSARTRTQHANHDLA